MTQLLPQVDAFLASLQQAVDGLSVFGAKGDSMVAYHVKVQAFGIHRMAAELARHSASLVGNRLFQQEFSF